MQWKCSFIIGQVTGFEEKDGLLTGSRSRVPTA
jgi:hypothetical protein